MIKKKRKYYSGGGWLTTQYKDSEATLLQTINQGLKLASDITGTIAKTQGKTYAQKLKNRTTEGSGLSKSDVNWLSQFVNSKDGSFNYNSQTGKYDWHHYSGGGTMNKISAGLGGASGMLDGYVQASAINEGAINSAKQIINSVTNNKVTSNSFASLLADQQNAKNAFSNYTYKNFKGSTGKQVMGTVSGSISGASAGATIGGPWGAVIGGVLGLGAGIAGIFRGNSKARKQAKIANSFALAANKAQNENLLNKANTLKRQQARSFARSFVADGGLLNFGQDMNYYSTGGAIDYANMQQYLNNYRTVGLAKQNVLQSVQQQPYMPEMPLYGFGGNLGTNGADFTDGLTYFDAGGRHEENPNQGVPQGIAPDGQPNLVEEGEVKWNEKEYIFSDRLHVSEAFLTRWKLPKSYSDKTFAYIVKNADVIKEAEQRPNDPASQETMDQFLAELAEDQEQVKKEKEAFEIQEQLSQMSDEELAALGQSLQQQQQPQEIIDQPTDYDQLAQNAQEEYANQQAMQQQVAQQEGLQQPMMGACGGNLHAEGGDMATSELQQNMEDSTQQINPFTGAVPQEELPMEIPQQEVPQEEVPQEQPVQEEQPQQKPAEEMSTKELNQAIEDIIAYAKEIKDRQLLREAKKIKKASREEKEEFVDETLEEIREAEMEKQQQEVPQEEVPQEQIPQEQMPTEQPMMMAEGGELPIEEQPIEQMPQETEEQSQVEQPQEEQTEQSQEQKDSITELLNLADSLGMTQDTNFTEEEVKKLRKKAEELDIAKDILSNEDAAIADILNDAIVQKKQEEEANNVATNGEPQVAQEVSQEENQFEEGGTIEKQSNISTVDPFKELQSAYNFINSPEGNAFQRKRVLERVSNNASKEELLQASIIEEVQKRNAQKEILNTLLNNPISVFENRQPKKFATGGKLFFDGGAFKAAYKKVYGESLPESYQVDSIYDKIYPYLDNIDWEEFFKTRSSQEALNYIFRQNEDDSYSPRVYNEKDKDFFNTDRGSNFFTTAAIEALPRKIQEKLQDAQDEVEVTKEGTKEHKKAVEKLEEVQKEVDKQAKELQKKVESDYNKMYSKEEQTALGEEYKQQFIQSRLKQYQDNPNLETLTRKTAKDYRVQYQNQYDEDNAYKPFTLLDNSTITPADNLFVTEQPEDWDYTKVEGYKSPITTFDTSTLYGIGTQQGPNQVSLKKGNGNNVSKIDKFTPGQVYGQAVNTIQDLQNLEQYKAETQYNIDNKENLKWYWNYLNNNSAHKIEVDENGIPTAKGIEEYKKLRNDDKYGIYHYNKKQTVTPEHFVKYRLANEDGTTTEVFGDPTKYNQYYNISDGVDEGNTTWHTLSAKPTTRNLIRRGDQIYQIPDNYDLNTLDKDGDPVITNIAPGVINTDNYYKLKPGQTIEDILKGKKPSKEFSYKDSLNTLLRMAPLFNQPFLDSYNSANVLSNIASNLKWTDAPRHGEYLKYKPVDTLYKQNQIMIDADAGRRGIMNAANGNTGMLMANLALQNSKAQQAIGENLINSETENWNRIKDVINQHNEVDKIYDQLAVEADKANMGNNSLLTSTAEKQADLLYKIENGNNTSRSAALADKLGIIHQIGTENNALNRYYQHKKWMDSAAEGGEIIIRRKQRPKRYS